MVKHKANYLKFFGYTVADWIPCENCGYTASQFHHLQFKSQGGSDDPINVMALCVSTPDREGCHDKAHNSNREFNAMLKEKHLKKYYAWKNCKG